MKHRVYADKIRDIDHLKDVIKREVNVIRADKDLLRRVCNSVTGRVEECISASGGHFESNH